MKIRLPYWQVLAIPILLIFAGALSNQAVLIANHDKFPVMINARQRAAIEARRANPWDFEIHTPRRFVVLGPLIIPISVIMDQTAVQPDPDGMMDNIHCVMGKNSRFKALADIWDLQSAIYSVGDGGIILGSWLWSFAPFAWLVLATRKLIAG